MKNENLLQDEAQMMELEKPIAAHPDREAGASRRRAEDGDQPFV